MVNDVEHLFICLLATCIIVFEEMSYLGPLPIFLLPFFPFLNIELYELLLYFED